MNFSSSIRGIQEAFGRQDLSAHRVANITAGATEAGGPDLAGEMVNQITNRHAVSLNTEVIRTADNMLGELIDLQA